MKAGAVAEIGFRRGVSFAACPTCRRAQATAWIDGERVAEFACGACGHRWKPQATTEHDNTGER